MKEEILNIASDLREGFITSNEAKEQLLLLFDVSRRSEQLCQHSWVKHPSHPIIGAMVCLKCGNELA
jgi:hypothetical protein